MLRSRATYYRINNIFYTGRDRWIFYYLNDIFQVYITYMVKQNISWYIQIHWSQTIAISHHPTEHPDMTKYVI